MFKEHPTNNHYIGTQENRDFLIDTITGYYSSFLIIGGIIESLGEFKDLAYFV